MVATKLPHGGVYLTRLFHERDVFGVPFVVAACSLPVRCCRYDESIANQPCAIDLTIDSLVADSRRRASSSKVRRKSPGTPGGWAEGAADNLKEDPKAHAGLLAVTLECPRALTSSEEVDQNYVAKSSFLHNLCDVIGRRLTSCITRPRDLRVLVSGVSDYTTLVIRGARRLSSWHTSAQCALCSPSSCICICVMWRAGRLDEECV
ncbi:PREDICTED: uncharacterized protein LOC105459304 [Wasmannia auropunctata]|uniref:uncharacterized protein LOC105459304 n=1 Tax=Wasmannia auropunctata TaxID=64793 RepID=UPI0005EE6390|nr:PREDICTED: uncharacterized protein LOC105459304 [Wasmannia auropunctata]